MNNKNKVLVSISEDNASEFLMNVDDLFHFELSVNNHLTGVQTYSSIIEDYDIQLFMTKISELIKPYSPEFFGLIIVKLV